MVKYRIKSWNKCSPVNIYLPIDKKPVVTELAETYGLDKHYSLNFIYYYWKEFSEIIGTEWVEPTKEKIEYVFNLELLEI